ncbi:hypothetical protein [Pseudomonas pharyngis]|uniref:hypothetical protein n=1 Tax=Pseudomonas pharyngis TaxID=2892333 RepID=UPI003FD3AEB3
MNALAEKKSIHYISESIRQWPDNGTLCWVQQLDARGVSMPRLWIYRCSFVGKQGAVAEHLQKIAEHPTFSQARKNPVDH